MATLGLSTPKQTLWLLAWNQISRCSASPGLEMFVILVPEILISLTVGAGHHEEYLNRLPKVWF
jgi:hypothetical protein